MPSKKASTTTKAPAEDARPKKRGESEAEASGEARARSFWSGTITFGLVTIPVELYASTRTTRTSLRMLAPSGAPVARRYFSSSGEQLDPDAIERGYELEDGAFVVVSDDELEALAPEQSRNIDLTRFVEQAAIPPLLNERVYILAPSGSSPLAYRLLADTLERTERAGLGSFVMRGKQHLVAIVAQGGLLRAETLRFPEELRTPESIGLPTPPAQPADERVKALRKAIRAESKDAPAQKELADAYWKRLESLVKEKQRRGEDIVTPDPTAAEDENMAEVIDLVAVLRRSLAESAPSPAPKEAATKRAPTKKKASAKKATKQTPAKRAPKPKKKKAG